MSTKTFKDMAVQATVQKWLSGGCYAAVGKDWLGKQVAVFFQDGNVEFRTVGGSEGGQKYIAQMADNRAGENVIIILPEALDTIFRQLRKNPGFIIGYKSKLVAK